jgi:hypothetical protein
MTWNGMHTVEYRAQEHNAQRVCFAVACVRTCKHANSYISNPKLRCSADQYFKQGDLWGMLHAINADYEKKRLNEEDDDAENKLLLRMVCVFA